MMLHASMFSWIAGGMMLHASMFSWIAGLYDVIRFHDQFIPTCYPTDHGNV
jgi:hypothetical protein